MGHRILFNIVVLIISNVVEFNKILLGIKELVDWIIKFELRNKGLVEGVNILQLPLFKT